MSGTKTNFRLHMVSQRRQDFYKKWLIERHLDLKLRHDREPLVEHRGQALQAIVQPFDSTVKAGDIRLLSPGMTASETEPVYVAVLQDGGNGTVVIAPFSRFSTPCCKDEWLIGLSAHPLQVLQLWNATTVPVRDIAMTWRTGCLTEKQQADANELYHHSLQGTFPKGELRENTGLTITSPDDDRLVYQQEEYELLAPLHYKMFQFVTEFEEIFAKAPAKGKIAKAGQQAKALLNVFDVASRRWHASTAGLPMAAAGGELAVQVVVLDKKEVSSVKDAQSVLLAKHEIELGMETIQWDVEDHYQTFDLRPGLIAILVYEDDGKEKLINGWTILDGKVVEFDNPGEEPYKKIVASCKKGKTKIGIIPA